MIAPTMIVTDADRRRLGTVLEAAQRRERLDYYLFALEADLEQARVVEPTKVPANVVTMNSIVRLRNLGTGELETYTLSYPDDADIRSNRISIFAPIGIALLGQCAGDEVEWFAPAGKTRLRIEEILYQPERAGAFHL